jgi:lipopolysaccharide assembly protein A
MRQLLGIIVFVPLAVVIGIFAVENRAPLELEVWPFAGRQEMWASVWILGLLALGIIIGLVIGWLAGGGARRRARRAERLNRTLERQLLERDPEGAEAAENASRSTSRGVLQAPSGRPAQIARIED